MADCTTEGSTSPVEVPFDETSPSDLPDAPCSAGFGAVMDEFAGLSQLKDPAEIDKKMSQIMCDQTPQVPVPPKEDSAPPSAELDDELKGMKDAMDAGNFDLRGALGQKWSKAKDASPSLAKDYAKVGRSYKAQREFRLRWLQCEYDSIIQKRSKTDSRRQLDEVKGLYKPFSVMVRDEGQDDAAVKACLNIVDECLRRQAAGKLAGGRKPWFRINPLSKRVEWLHLSEGYSDSFEENGSLRPLRAATRSRSPPRRQVLVNLLQKPRKPRTRSPGLGSGGPRRRLKSWKRTLRRKSASSRTRSL